MTKSEYIIIGVMSGTSLDGLDLAKVKFSWLNNKWNFELLEGRTSAFPKDLYNSLQNSMNLTGLELATLDIDLGQFIGTEVSKFNLNGIDAIASHGHTIFHEPKKGLTVQIGSISYIHAITSLPVIGDFRSLDVALGGQGAPLVPLGDEALFSEYDATLNFGGIANITILGKALKAFDICPLNQVSNFLCQQHFNCEYDESGSLGKKGSVDLELLRYFDDFPYYNVNGPKSLGKEDVDAHFISSVKDSQLKPSDILRTYYEHVAGQITIQLSHHKTKTVLCSGGGVYNQYLIDLISQKTGSATKLILPEKEIIEFKEALIFAFLGLLRGLEQTNVSRMVTGSSDDTIGGVLIGKNPFR